MNEYYFAQKLAWSRGRAETTDIETIRQLIPGCVSVVQASPELDRRGIDYIAALRRGATLYIDIKARECGVSKHWKSAPLYGIGAPEPELTLEIWSVCPRPPRAGVPGWTLDESKLTDYVLYVFDAADTNEAFLIPFQLLRMAFKRNFRSWTHQFKIGTCSSNGGKWQTESVFVPAWCVLDAIQNEMRQTLPATIEPANGASMASVVRT